MKKLIIFGEYSTALEIRETAKHDYEVINVKFEDDFLMHINGYSHDTNYHYIMSFSDYSLRQKCQNALSAFSNFILQTIVHPSAVIFDTAQIGSGCYIAATAVISHKAILDENCIINFGVSVGHDAYVGKNVVLMPGARIGGNCKIGEGCMIGTNSFVYQSISIGDHTFIDAMTYINKNIGNKEMVKSTQNLKIIKNIFFNGK